MSYRIGQRVVCIYDGAWAIYGHEATPVCGHVYTIRGISTESTSGMAFLLEEIRNKPDLYTDRKRRAVFKEKLFRAERFRPLTERKTDISFAVEILRKTTRKRSVDA